MSIREALAVEHRINDLGNDGTSIGWELKVAAFEGHRKESVFMGVLLGGRGSWNSFANN